MAWDSKANLRGPAGYNATGAAEDDAAVAAFIKSAVGSTATAKAIDEKTANLALDPASKTGTALANAIEVNLDAVNKAKRAGQNLHADYVGTQREGVRGMTVGALRKFNAKSDSATDLGTATLTATNTVVTISAHGLAVGDRIRFGEGGTVPATVVVGNNYFVRAVVSATEITLNRDSGVQLQWAATGGSAPLYKWPLATAFAASASTGLLHPAFRFSNAPAIQSAATVPYSGWVKSNPAALTFSPGTLTGPSVLLETIITSTTVDLILVHNPAALTRIWVDGRLALTLTSGDFTAAGIVVSTASGRLTISFPAKAQRKIGIEVTAGNVAGIEYLDAEPPLYPTDQRGARTMIQGDSYTEGGSAAPGMHFTSWVQRLMGWNDVWRSGSGGTGYLAPGARKALIDRYQNDIITQAPDRLILAHGANDATATTAAVKSAAETIIDAVRGALPATEIIVVGPFVPKSPAAPIHVAHDAALQDVAKARGLQFISPIQESWIIGTGKEGAPAGNGNADIYISADGVHPTPAGHEYLGWRLAGHLVK